MIKAIEKLLLIDFNFVAKSIGLPFEDVSAYQSEASAYEIINDIELAVADKADPAIISAVCGLFWTHFSERFDLVSAYVYKVMGRIGFGPTFAMLTNKESGRLLAPSLFDAFESNLIGRSESVKAFGSEFILTRYQKQLWDAIDESPCIAISAPTSAGKSFLICLKLLSEVAQSNSSISIYIVPTLTLMNQVSSDLLAMARENAIGLDVRTHLSNNDSLTDVGRVVFVVTQERLVEFSKIEEKFRGVHFLIIDEVQNIERAFTIGADQDRARMLLDVIVDIHDNLRPKKTLICGPRISDVGKVGSGLFKRDCRPVSTFASPVTNVAYAILPGATQASIVIAQYSELISAPVKKTFPNLIRAMGFKRSQYNADYHEYIQKFTDAFSNGIVFSPTSRQSRRTAMAVAAGLLKLSDTLLNSLVRYVADTVSPNYDLAFCLARGVGFHHGKMPHHVRNAVEYAVSKGLLSTVVCTTTLMQGVNIPAKNIILRNPNLFLKKDNDRAPVLSPYEIANLRGRAGRLLRDFVGRTFILDGSSFETSEQQSSLFEPTVKTLDGSYQGVFTRNREAIMIDLTVSNHPQSGLSKYIRNVMYSEPDASARLLRKGIVFSNQEVEEIKGQLLELNIDKEICRQYRYWDPVELQKLKDASRGLDLPESPFRQGAVNQLSRVLDVMYAVLPEIVRKYLGSQAASNSKKRWVLCKIALEWAHEVPLCQMLNNAYIDGNNDKTEETIAMLQNIVAYGLPALLRPLYSISGKGNFLLSTLERGVYHPANIVLVNNNLPRETVLAFKARATPAMLQETSIAVLRKYLQAMPFQFWDRIQFLHLLPSSDLR